MSERLGLRDSVVRDSGLGTWDSAVCASAGAGGGAGSRGVVASTVKNKNSPESVDHDSQSASQGSRCGKLVTPCRVSSPESRVPSPETLGAAKLGNPASASQAPGPRSPVPGPSAKRDSGTNTRKRRATTASAFGRVAVVMGGSSSEREVSLDSGRSVLEALVGRGIDAHAIDGIPALLDALRAGHFARVFNILHGQHGGGEDGVLQGALASLHVPCTGSGVLGSALSMDKVRAKRVWQALGLPTPAFVPLPRGGDVHAAAREVGFPLVVKPASEGSSVGVTRVFAEADLDQARALAERYPGDLMVEHMVVGDELTVGLVGDQALPSIHIVPAGEYYDYDAKYKAADTQYLCPGLEGEAENQLCTLALQAFAALDCSGWGRVDLMRDREGRAWLLEVNTAPGMTSHSLVPKAAAVAGMDYAELCWRILETSLGGAAGSGGAS